jgi:hypothetical protein
MVDKFWEWSPRALMYSETPEKVLEVEKKKE